MSLLFSQLRHLFVEQLVICLYGVISFVRTESHFICLIWICAGLLFSFFFNAINKTIFSMIFLVPDSVMSVVVLIDLIRGRSYSNES